MSADRAAFIAAAGRAAFDTGQPCPRCDGKGSVPGGRRVIHTYAGPLGADWDVQDVQDAIRDAAAIEWNPNPIFGHGLIVTTADGRRLRFDVPHPDGAS